jgi:uncharacterized protein YdaL
MTKYLLITRYRMFVGIVIKFNAKFNGHDPIISNPNTITDVNGIALYNVKKDILFGSWK